MKLRKYAVAAFIALTFGASSCDDFLDVKPQQSLGVDQALSSLSSVEQVVLGMYDQMQQLNYYGRTLIVHGDIMADNTLLTADNSGRYVAQYSYNVASNNGDVSGLYINAYETIKNANDVLNNIDNLAVEGEANIAKKNQLKGEALFGRALAYFDLVKSFGRPYTEDNGASLGVPLVLSDADGFNPRATVAEIYNQIVSDLQQAATLMTFTTPYRASNSAAYALLSRVYLYQGKNQEAIDAANNADDGNFNLLSGSAFVNSWSSSGSPEEIFTLRFVLSENRGADNLGAIFLPRPNYGDVRPTQDIIEMYEPSDVRLSFIGPAEDGDDFLFKYPGEESPGLSSPRVIRYAEVLLNRAEANAKLGNFSAAAIDVNTIRAARGVAPITVSSVNDVLDERRRELAFEGHRLFDLTRNGLDIVRIENSQLAGAPSVIQVTDHRVILPIPQREIDSNPALVQNPGY